MTDDPTRPDDEFVAAVLDGEATDAERARVEGDPRLSARLAEFARVRDLVATPVDPLDDATKQSMLDRALAAAGGSVADAPSPGTGSDPDAEEQGDVIGLDGARRRRFERHHRALLAAAAVVAVLGLAGGLVSILGDDGEGAEDATAADQSETAAGDLAVPDLELGEINDTDTLVSEVADATGLDLSTEAAADSFIAEAPSVAELADGEGGDQAGQVSDSGEDTTAEREADESAARSTEESDEDRSVEDCSIALLDDRPSLIGQLAQGTVTYQGTPAYVFVYNDADLAGAITLVTARADCRVLAEVPV